MIPRYSLPEMAALFTDEARLEKWLEVELLAIEAWAAVGTIPRGDRRRRAGAGPEGHERPGGSGGRTRERHRPRRRRLRRRRPGGHRRARRVAGPLRAHLVRRRRHRPLRHPDRGRRPAARRVRRTGGGAQDPGASSSWTRPWPAGPTGCTPSRPPSGPSWPCGASRPTATASRLRAARARVAVGKLSGAVGTYSNIDPEVEAYVCRALGLTPVPATQVIARDRHAELLWACAVGGGHRRDDRHRDPPSGPDRGGRGRGGLRGGPEGQLGHAPQAQPHPVRAADAAWPGCCAATSGPGSRTWPCGTSATSPTPRWSASSSPTPALLTYYVLRRGAGLVDGLVVHPDRMRANVVEGSFGLVFSQPVLLALVASGMSRDAAYRIVQRDARRRRGRSAGRSGPSSRRTPR